MSVSSLAPCLLFRTVMDVHYHMVTFQSAINFDQIRARNGHVRHMKTLESSWIGARNGVKENTVYARVTNINTIVRGIVKGLNFIHGHNQVHRDLKPRNSRSRGIMLLNLVLYSPNKKT